MTTHTRTPATPEQTRNAVAGALDYLDDRNPVGYTVLAGAFINDSTTDAHSAELWTEVRDWLIGHDLDDETLTDRVVASTERLLDAESR